MFHLTGEVKHDVNEELQMTRKGTPSSQRLYRALMRRAGFDKGQ